MAGGFPFPRGGAFLGVETRPLTPDVKARLGVMADEGVVVGEVVPQSPAAKAGIQADDVITEVNGQKVADPNALRQAIRKAGIGQEVALKVERGKEEKEFKAKLEEAPSDVFMFPEPGSPGEGFPPLPPGFGDSQRRIQKLERQVEDLEKRLRDLEQKQGQTAPQKE